METLTASSAAVKQPSLATRYRVTSIDFLRGLVMVIMALDHVRDFFHNQAMTGDPTNMATTTPILFFTRWITHFCAPTFVFLAGTSAFLSGQKRTKKELSLFLIKRGFWLVFIEAVVITFGWTFNPFYNTIILQVIWAIGISMVLLGALVWLPFEVILLTGALIVLGHNLLDKPEADMNGHVSLLWDILHRSRFSFHELFPGHYVILVYAFAPWTGVMLLGYGLGKLFTKEVHPLVRRRALFIIGSSAVVLFILLRYINQYGDPSPWHVQRNNTYTVMSFLNVTKYPPSLMYLLMTLGPSILFLAFFERVQNTISRFFITYGRVPFFYYVLHIYLIHIGLVAAFYMSGYTSKDIISPKTPFFFRPPHFGYDLWIVYLIWAAVVLALYLPCRWYNKYKSTHSQWWLSYL